MLRNAFIFAPFAILILAICTVAQLSIPGQVIDVIDGKTVVVATSTGKIKVELQYIDVPDPSQKLHITVKDHLSNLVSGKVVEYRPRTILKDRTIGRLMLNNVDVSQQMLRDGAAWHIPSQVSGQEQADFDLYASTEAVAKNEKRGVWAIPELKPSRETRTEERKRAEAQEQNLSALNGSARSVKKNRSGKWGDVNPSLGNVGALYNGYNAESRTGFLSTGISMVNLNNAALDERFQNAKLYVDITYWYKEESSGRKGTFVLTLISENDVAMFTRNQEMLLIIDNGRIAVGRGKRVESRSGGKVFEKLTFNISRSNMEHMAKDVTVMKIADQLLEPQTIRYILYNMLQIAQ